MKTYSPANCELWLVLSIVTCSVAGIGALVMLFALSDLGATVFFLFILPAILCPTVYFSIKSRHISVGEDALFLPRGLHVTRSDGTSFLRNTRTTLPFIDIEQIQKAPYKSKRKTTVANYFYIITLHDGTEYRLTLYEYGRIAENELLLRLSPDESIKEIES